MEELRELIKARYKNLTKFAQAVGCPPATVCNILNRKHDPSFRIIVKWCSALGIPRASIGEVFFRDALS